MQEIRSEPEITHEEDIAECNSCEAPLEPNSAQLKSFYLSYSSLKGE